MSKCDTCKDMSCSARNKLPDERDEEFNERQLLLSRLCRIKHKVMVLSGKGGVGKSTVAVNVAAALAMSGKRVGILDVDIHGPSVPKLLNLVGRQIQGSGEALLPVSIPMGDGVLNIMSIGFLLRSRDDAVIWRGPMKFGVIKQFFRDVEWGDLDYLVIDSPPGTGDEPLTVAQLIGKDGGVIVVTTPQEIAIQDVRRCITFCRQVGLRIIGVVENMSGFTCPKCGEFVRIFGADGGRAMAAEMDVRFLGSIPIEPAVVTSGDNGIPIVQLKPESESAKAFSNIALAIQEARSRE